MKQQKAAIRAEARAILKSMNSEVRAVASAAICETIRKMIPSRGATVLFYAAHGPEPNVWPLLLEALKGGNRVALPRFDEVAGQYVPCLVDDANLDLVPGQFGIREPGAHCRPLVPASADWILVPGLAFDLQGRRLGRGRGFYDRLLAKVAGKRCGVAFDAQFLKEMPTEPHDLRMDAIVTPTRWFEMES